MKWDYRVVEVATDPKTIEKKLKELGSAGWEIIHVLPDVMRMTGPKCLLFFKRPVN